MAASAKPNLFLRRPVLSAGISILITLVGALAMKALPIAQYPDLVPPTVNVSVSYPGASAETIAATVLAPLEVNINGVENMLYMNRRTYWPGMMWPSALAKTARALMTPVLGCTWLSMKVTSPSPLYMLPSSRRSCAL